MAEALTTLRAAKSALEMQQTGLQWYRGMMPEYVDGSDNEADAETSSAITDLRTLIASMEAQEPTTDNSSIRGYEVGASVYRLQSEANKAINRGEGTHWVALYRANHTAQPSEPKAEPSPAMLKVVRGDICCKSLDMDQSYGMWVPVTYSTEHGFVDGTCFYAAPQARKPLTEEQIYEALEADIVAMESSRNDPESWAVIVEMVRAIESAHGIEGGAA